LGDSTNPKQLVEKSEKKKKKNEKKRKIDARNFDVL